MGSSVVPKLQAEVLGHVCEALPALLAYLCYLDFDQLRPEL